MLYKTLSAPITCQIELTTACDNNCLHCYNHWRHEDDSENYNFTNDILEKITNEIIESGVFQVTFTGGETLLMKNVLDLLHK